MEWKLSCALRTDRQTDRWTDGRTDVTNLIVALPTRLKILSVHVKHLMKLPFRKGTRDLKGTWKESVERLYEIWLKIKMSLPVPGRQLVKRVF